MFAAVTLVGILTLVLLRRPEEKKREEEAEVEESGPSIGAWEVFQSTARLCVQPRMLLIVVVFFYTGLELSFIESIYPTSIGFTLALGTNTHQLLAANMIVGGVGMVAGSFLFSRTAFLKREVIVAIGCAAQLGVYAGVFVNLPGNASLFRTAESSGFIKEPQVWLMLACGFLLGFADACWTTQTMAHLITWHKAESTQANSLFRFFQASAACLGFALGSKFRLEWHLLVLAAGALAGCAGFFAAERLNASRKREEATARMLPLGAVESKLGRTPV
ncbi:hypothetical protein M3Y99_00754900 [Aphelenchoides fujianensis]|nr:hypothetical protein M3Y99_00754900 [Aphelenchoides fujianensis]